MLSRSVAELTGTLRPANGSAEADLDRGRFLLASALRSGQTSEEFRGVAPLGVNPNAAQEADRFLHLFESSPAASMRAIARIVPSSTSLHPSSPEWARGIAVSHSLGPFLTPLGTPIWIDAFEVIQLTRLTRNSATLLGLFPIDYSQSTSQNIVLGAGSVWIPAQLLAPNSPNDSFTGFRIKRGTLTLSERASSVNAASWDISLATIATLTVDFDPPPSPPIVLGPGVDSMAANITLPTSATIEFGPTGAQLTALSDSSVNVYGQAVPFHWNGAVPAFEGVTNEIVTLLTFTTNQFHVSAAESEVLVLSGTGPIQAASWALPVATTTPGNLGEAAGAGALMLAIGAGLSQRWAGLTQAADLNETWLHLIPGQIVILALGSGTQQTPQVFDLWLNSTIDFASTRPFISFYLSQPGSEWFEVGGDAVAHLDRPLRADGSRFALRILNGALIISQTMQGFGVQIGLALNTKTVDKVKRMPIVLQNALVLVDSPVAMSVFGELDSSNPNAVKTGLIGLEFGVRGLLPTLPDPYACSLAAKDFSDSDETPLGILITAVNWENPYSPDMALNLLLADLPTMADVRGERGLSLLDLSTNADLFGVEFSLIQSSEVAIENMALALPGNDVTVFTVPQISWEPMKSDPAVAGLHADSDGGPSKFRVETVNLVRVEPGAALRFLEAEVAASRFLEASFTLPFGLVAHVKAGELPLAGGTFRLTQPVFRGYSGGLQLTLGAPHPEVEDASLPGTCEATDPYGKAVLGADPEPDGTASVATMFNEEFLTGTINIDPPPPTRVPVKRIDFSGYGASMFSDWRDSKIETGIIKVQFDVLVGRTAFEVVKAQSYMYPWSAIAVRTVTIERQGAGWVHRADSGWQPASDGVFNFPAHEKADYLGHVHPGAVLGVVNIRNIREVRGGLISVSGLDTHQVNHKLDFQQVLFDADVWISTSFYLTNGGHVHAGRQLVPSKDIGGYLQLTPGDGASRQQLAELLKKTGPVGGPIACIGNVGGPTGPQLTAVSMDVSINKTGPDAELVAALRGSLSLPKDGAWTIAKQDGSSVPAALDPKFHLPLVQNSNAPGKWHFADPADIAQINAPSIAYGLVQATGTQKMFFARPSIDEAAPTTFNLPHAPHLGDIGALLNATGLFPDLGAAISFPSIPPLGVSGTDISLPATQFTLTGQTPKPLVDFGAVKVLLDYSDGGKINPDTHDREVPVLTRVDVHITPGADPDPTWSITLDPISLVLVTPFGDQQDPILRVVGGAKADSKTAPTLTRLDVQYGGALGFVQTVFSKLAEIASSLPGAPFSKLDVNFSQGRLTIKDVFALPTLPLGFGYVTDVSLNLGTSIQLSPQSLEFTAGIGSEQKPFHWLVSPLSGTGVVQVGVRNGDLAILIEAGIGAGLAIDLAIASGSASVVIAIQINNEVSPFQIKAILTGQASVDVLNGLASASITLSAALGITPDQLPIPDKITLFAGVSVGIHLSVCWLVSVDFDGSWSFSETLEKPGIVPF
ncbi:MAG: hypothetical protein HY287_02585 [Planctomycetes bacterium]|nr:hypothetical protein [Planctomycetota bacterium]MBI3833197.1 hypothetical protein [Planctomycetota bacterium]